MEGIRILDIGCGTGNLEQHIKDCQKECSIMAVDASSAMLRRAKQKFPAATFYQVNLNRPLQEQGIREQFDVIFGINVLYTLQNPSAVIKELSGLASPGAIMVQATPKAGARLLPILKEHRQNVRTSAESRRQIRLTLALLLLGLFNIVILKRQQRGEYHFPSQEQIYQWYENSGWTIKELTTTYADQNWLVVAQKTI